MLAWTYRYPGWYRVVFFGALPYWFVIKQLEFRIFMVFPFFPLSFLPGHNFISANVCIQVIFCHHHGHDNSMQVSFHDYVTIVLEKYILSLIGTKIQVSLLKSTTSIL